MQEASDFGGGRHGDKSRRGSDGDLTGLNLFGGDDGEGGEHNGAYCVEDDGGGGQECGYGEKL